MTAHSLLENQGSVAVIGLGNIGSHLATLAARLPEVKEILLVDSDFYEMKNLYSQDITESEIGKSKAEVTALRLQGIRPGLTVRAICARVKDISLGLLRADAVISCVDSFITRQYLNKACWRLGVPLIDSGVDASSLLARANVYLPVPDAACVECSWDTEYNSLEHQFGCYSGPLATNAPSYLGAAAASMLAAELSKLLRGDFENLASGKQVMLDLKHHCLLTTKFTKNPKCRFDHITWQIGEFNNADIHSSLADLIKEAAESAGLEQPVMVAIEGRPFITRLTCTGCGNQRDSLHLSGRMDPGALICECGGRLVSSGFDMVEKIRRDPATEQYFQAPILSMGFRSGDIVSLGDGKNTVHYQIRG